tara:strand:+ start:21949 stop:22722 length:774 start_codon:yes stop_codon:yes gene_type:complete
MISVIEVYNTVRDLCNKDQKGFVTPKVFNSFAEVAQQSVFNEMFKELSMAKQLRSRGLDPSGADSSYRGIKDDLSNFVTQVLYDEIDTPLLYVTANVFKRPLDLYKIISLRYDLDGGESTATWADVELVYNTERIPQILNSNLSAPTASFPVALISREIEVFPSDEAYGGSLVINYYRNPASLTLSGVLDTSQGPKIMTSGEVNSDGFFVLNPSSSRHFELPERFKSEVISEIAKMIGVRLRDAELSAYGNQETTAN